MTKAAQLGQVFALVDRKAAGCDAGEARHRPGHACCAGMTNLPSTSQRLWERARLASTSWPSGCLTPQVMIHPSYILSTPIPCAEVLA